MMISRSPSVWLSVCLGSVLTALVVSNPLDAGDRRASRAPATPHWRPQYHFRPESGWLNDPNGMVYSDRNRRYHLFYQYHPHDIRHDLPILPFPIISGEIRWGHAVSHNLVNWTHRPVSPAFMPIPASVLPPTPPSVAFSGSAVSQGSRLTAIYTQATFGGAGDQSQSLAFSDDGGTTWRRHPRNPVLTKIDKAASNPHFRDPKVVWYAPGKHWVMALAAGP